MFSAGTDDCQKICIQVMGAADSDELGSTLATTGQLAEAKTMLGEVYGWFTEGFETADCKMRELC